MCVHPRRDRWQCVMGAAHEPGTGSGLWVPAHQWRSSSSGLGGQSCRNGSSQRRAAIGRADPRCRSLCRPRKDAQSAGRPPRTAKSGPPCGPRTNPNSRAQGRASNRAAPCACGAKQTRGSGRASANWVCHCVSCGIAFVAALYAARRWVYCALWPAGRAYYGPSCSLWPAARYGAAALPQCRYDAGCCRRSGADCRASCGCCTGSKRTARQSRERKNAYRA